MATMEFPGLELETRDLHSAHVRVIEPDELVRQGELPEEKYDEAEQPERGGGASEEAYQSSLYSSRAARSATCL